jgi:hypothetical protein
MKDRLPALHGDHHQPLALHFEKDLAEDGFQF